MSSSSPPNLHLSLPPSNTSTAPVLHLSLPNTSFKRSFEHYIESPAATLPPSHESIDGSTASSSGSSMSSPDGGDENRRKRARSASTLNESEDRSSEASSSTLSSLDSDDSLSHSGSSQAPRRHLLLDLGLGRTLGSSVALGLGMAAAELQLGGRATSEPPPRIPTPELLESEDVDMPDIDLGFSRDEERDEEEEPTSPADNVRRSVDRFNAFDRHISVLRSSSPPVIPLPTSLSSRHASLSPPTLPPLPLVDLGLDPEDDDEDEPEHIPSVPTNISTTPPRLDLNLPPTSSLSPGRSSHIAPDEPPTQFRERLDSALTGIGSGGLHFEAPISPTDERVDDGPSFDSYFEPARDPLGATSAGSSSDARASASASHYHPRTLDENPLFEWSVPPALDWDAVTLAARSSGSASAANTAQSPSPWRRYIRPSNNDSNENATTSPDTTVADLRRLLGTPLPARLFPRPPSLAAPLSTTISSLDTEPLDVNLDDAYLDLRMPNSRAWESALDRARTHHQQRGRERERREREQRERERERERQIEREREEETERERDNPWQLDSIWGSSSGVESFPSAPPRPRESSLTRMRREVEEDDLARRRAVERQLRQTLERTDRMMERHNRLVYGRQSPENGPSSSMARAARYLESGLVDPREAPSASGSRDRLRPPLDTSNSFTASWTSRRATRPTEDDGSASASASRLRSSQFRSSSQSRERAMDWLGRIERDEPSPQLDLFDEWLSEHPPPRSITPAVGSSRSGAYDDQTSDYLRRNGESSVPSSTDPWRTRGQGTWQPRLALSPQSAAQPTRTATHARAQSIPSSSQSSATLQPSLHRLRQRLHGPPRVGSTTSLVAESAAAIRRSEARSELMERLNRTMNMDIDALSDPESDFEFPTLLMSPPARNSPRAAEGVVDRDPLIDSDDDESYIFRPMASRPQHATRAHRFRGRQNDAGRSPLPSLRIPSGSVRPRPSFEQESEEPSAPSSSGLNSRRPFSVQTRRPIVRLRQHPVGGTEISPPASATASVDRRHVSWEAPSPSRDNGGPNTYQYLSALSHGFDSQSLSISDLAHTITRNSSNEALRSPQWGENSESPFSSLFTRSAAPPSLTRNVSGTARGPESIPSLPPPDLGVDFDRDDNMLPLASVEGLRRDVATTSTSSELPSRPTRPPSPPPHSLYTGPFRLTMQRREEALRRAAEASRRPDPPSIPPLYFGEDFDHGPTPSQPREQPENRDTRRPVSYQGLSSSSSRTDSYANSRFAEAERRLFSYRGPEPSSRTQGPDGGDPRRFFPSRPLPTSSTSSASLADRFRDVEERPSERRYSATDMHNVLARQARLTGSRLAPDLPSSAYSPSGDDTDGPFFGHHAFSTSRAQLISRYREQAEADARASSSSSSTPPWATQPRRPREETARADAENRRRRVMGSRPLMSEAEPPQMRHRALRDPSFRMMFGLHGPSARLRHRALGDYMRDEDFDASYENLISLSSIIGDVKPKATPDHILTTLETASYKDWATAESDQRCPICLDDYQPSDPVMKLGDCRHWLHKECLEQWLKGASTCPVCRKDVKGKGKRTPHRRPSGFDPHRRRDTDGPSGPGGPGPSGSGSGGGGGGGRNPSIPPANWLNFLTE